MNTEITDTTVGRAAGWVFYDGECPLCLGAVARFGPLLDRRGFHLASLQARWVQRRLGLEPEAPLTEIRMLLPDGVVLGGADALIAIARHIWWGWPLFLFAKIPGVLLLLRSIYVEVAARRNCVRGVCVARPRRHYWLAAPLPLLVLLLRNEMAPWVFMWALTFAIFLGCKWVTWQKAARGESPPTWTALGYFLAWPGMDAEAFLKRRTAAARRHAALKYWMLAVAKACVGVILVYLAASGSFEAGALLAGWLGVIGIILSLHFGLSDLLALMWERLGVNVTPLMRSPLAATSLAEFWGRRWNTGFSRLARELVFKPLARRCGVMWAALSVFLGSGLVHELVITVPARGGYGLPTAYFAVQGLGMLLERSRVGRALGLGRGRCGWAFAVIVLAAPLAWICPPVFIHHVILPMLDALGGH